MTPARRALVVQPPGIGRRPVVVLSRDAAIPRLQRALVAPCTTTIRGLPSEVESRFTALRRLIGSSPGTKDAVESVSVGALGGLVTRSGGSRVAIVVPPWVGSTSGCGAVRTGRLARRVKHVKHIPTRIPLRYTSGMATEQIAVRLAEEHLTALDDLIARGAYDSRAAVVRAGIEVVLELDRRRQAARATVEGYRLHPPSDAERHAAIASLREAIAEEPW